MKAGQQDRHLHMGRVRRAPGQGWGVLALALLAAVSGCATPGPAHTTAADQVPPAELQASFEEALREGDTSLRAGDVEKALFHYIRASQANKGSELPLLRIAAIHESRKQPLPARQALEEALRRVPGNAAAHEHLGFALLRLEEPDRAAAEFHEAARLDATRWRALMGLGLAASARGDLAAARGHYETALTLQPRSAELLSYSADLYLRSGELEAGIREARAALTVSPNPATQLVLGDLLCRTGDYVGGFEAYLASVDETTAYRRLGEEALLAKDYERALRYFQQAMSSSPVHSEQLSKRIAVTRERMMESRIVQAGATRG